MLYMGTIIPTVNNNDIIIHTMYVNFKQIKLINVSILPSIATFVMVRVNKTKNVFHVS